MQAVYKSYFCDALIYKLKNKPVVQKWCWCLGYISQANVVWFGFGTTIDVTYKYRCVERTKIGTLTTFFANELKYTTNP